MVNNSWNFCLFITFRIILRAENRQHKLLEGGNNQEAATVKQKLKLCSLRYRGKGTSGLYVMASKVYLQILLQ